MATYKVIQDIEAEDKFVGPLTLKQFIFGAGGVLASYLSFFAAIKGAYFLLVFFLPPALLGFFLAIPWSKDQPTETWVLAKLRFYFKPRKRIWDQDGLQELVTITVPKKIEKHLTNELSQTQVKSRLKALADTIDTRGWAVKNSAAGAYSGRSNDRLVGTDILPQQVSVLAADDIDDPMDEKAGPVAAQFDQMIQNSEQSRKSEMLAKMEQARNPSPPAVSTTNVPLPVPPPVQQNYAIPAVPPATPVTAPSATPATVPTDEERRLAEQLKQSSGQGGEAVGHMHTIPTSQPQAQKTDTKKAQASIPDTPSADIISLSQNNDLNVATIARQASRDEDADEVVVSLR